MPRLVKFLSGILILSHHTHLLRTSAALHWHLRLHIHMLAANAQARIVADYGLAAAANAFSQTQADANRTDLFPPATKDDRLWADASSLLRRRPVDCAYSLVLFVVLFTVVAHPFCLRLLLASACLQNPQFTCVEESTRTTLGAQRGLDQHYVDASTCTLLARAQATPADICF